MCWRRVRAECPILGVNGSWDQPTTKGPMLPGIAHVLAQSRQVVDDLARLPRLSGGSDRGGRVAADGRLCRSVEVAIARGVPGEASGCRRARDTCCSRPTLSGSASTSRRCVARCRQAIDRGDIRAARGALHAQSSARPRVAVSDLGRLPHAGRRSSSRRTSGTLDHLTNLIHHAEVVVASAGTINLDAWRSIRRRSHSRSRTKACHTTTVRRGATTWSTSRP